MRQECPISLRTCLMRTFPAVSSFLAVLAGPFPGCQTNVLAMSDLPRACARAVAERGRLHAALAGDLLDRRQALETFHRRAHHVVRIRRAEALREDVADADALHHGAHRAAGDDAGARRRGLHQHAPRPVLPDDLVRDRPAGQRDVDHRAAGGVDGLADRLRHLVRLARGEAHAPLTVADGDERVEGEAPAALHDLGDAVDRDHVLDEIAPLASAVALVATAAIAAAPTSLAAALTAAAARATGSARTSRTATTAAAGAAAARTASAARATSPARAAPAAAATSPAAAAATAATATATRRLGRLCTRRILMLSHVSELQPALAGTVGQRLHAAAVLVAGTVEDDLRAPCGLRL